MNPHLQNILNTIQQDKNLSEEEKNAIIKSLKDADKEFEIANFKLDRTEKVKRTTAILLEETIEELEQKRKAVEAQNRELEIESSLERVRAVAMGMMKADDLIKICEVQFNELKQLGFSELRNALIGIFYDDENYFIDYDYSDFASGNIHKIPYNMNSLIDRAVRRMKSANDAFTEFIVEGEELEEWKAFRKQNGEYDDTRIENADVLYYYFYSINSGNIGISTFKKISDDQLTILKRFRNVFDLAYRRYTDISTAEAQAREAQIEVAVERVRAQSMAMHQTTDLEKVNNELFNQLKTLEVYGLSGVSMYFFDEEGEVKIWDLSSPGNMGDLNSYTIKFSSKKYPVLGELWEHYKNSGDYFTQDYPLEKLKKAVGEFRDIDINMANAIEQAIKNGSLKHQWNAFGKIPNGLLGVDLMAPASEDTKTIVIKMAGAFNLAYKRFLDLQKAEAQTKEAKIEAALERTRTQSMIMQHSKELDDTLRVFHEQVLLLNIPSAFSFLWLPDEEKDQHIFWAAWAENGSPTQLVDPKSIVFKSKAINYPLDRNEPATAQCLVDWKGDEPIVSYHVPPSGVANYFAAWSELIAGVEQLKPEHFSGGLYYVEAFMKYGCFGVMVSKDLTEDEKKILGRFAIEFERTYRRFLDLQKAEAQAREAQIEAALEKVRSRSLAMHKSNEIGEVAWTVIEKMKELNIEMSGVSLVTYIPGSKDLLHWHVSTEHTGNSQTMLLPYFDDLIFNDCVEAKEKGMALLAKVYSKEEKNNYFNLALANSDFKNFPSASKQWIQEQPYLSFSYAIQNHSGIFLEDYTGKIFSDEENKVLIRFSKVFEQSYVRFLDLQKAEAQTKESQIEAALERVRSRTLAMQRSDELAETAAVLFRQLILLGIQPNRLYIAIVKDDNGTAEFWITDEDGSKVSSAFETNLNDNPTFQKMFEGWKAEKKSLVIDMNGEELQEYFKYLTSIHVPFKGGLTQKRRLQDIAYFSKGFIGMASPEELPAETLQLLERFAAVFNLTYTRFNDLQVSEAHAVQAEQDLIAIKDAKQKAEAALTELQSAQKQLIQSEKMASLGELTAGIAHEIQNPLNFVNNFSEVSVELIKEMIDEVEKGNNDEAKALADDLIQNLEKINHHGKRADGIVKGMLQHSRTTGTTKEPTDINKLADEYLRLAYHGLRAKDKSFNATLKTDFDETIGKINIIPQNIGRVILNLITNAFYAVDERRKQSINEYQPTVTVSTNCSPLLRRGVGGEVQIKVADNGNGIPKNIVDKIFQPFFTTKPTGQGTGLGLSLAYDIVKAHGGELKVETKENEGSTFIITIPFS